MDEFLQTTKEAGHEEETKRLSDIHEVITDAMGGLFMARVDLWKPGAKILDSATADVRWLKDLKNQLPRNICMLDVTFQKQSFTDPWPSDWKGTFDVVHQRLGIAGAAHHPISEIVGNLSDLCRSGGWVELVELDVRSQCQENGPAVNDWLKLMREIFTDVGVGNDFALNRRKHLQRAGLEQVEQHRIECRCGAKAKANLAEKSTNGVVSAVKPLIALARTLPTISLSTEQLDGLQTRLREELERQGGVYGIMVAYGRKP